LIDTPGIREVATMGEGDGVDLTFAEVADVAATCRFTDCAHDGTPGCAVDAAIAAGELTAERVAQYLAELDRQAAFDRRVEARARKPEGRPRKRRHDDD
jgi:ribosome biogenesis GTPase